MPPTNHGSTDFTPPPSNPLTQEHLWKEFWPPLVSLLTQISTDLQTIGSFLEQIADAQKEMTDQNKAASEINRFNLDQLRAQLGHLSSPTSLLAIPKKR